MENGEPHGTTVGAFASLSMQRPMVLVSLDRGSNLLARVRRTARFDVNLLGSAHSDLALRFAQRDSEKFAGVAWQLDHDLPRVGQAPGWLACEVAELVEAGDHVVLLGSVVAADTVRHQPLTYHMRSFGTHVPLAGAV